MNTTPHDPPPTLEINLIPIDGYEKDDLRGLLAMLSIKHNVDQEIELDGTLRNFVTNTSISKEMYELTTGSEEQISIVLDWAMQIRQATQYPWSLCMQVASIFYYG